MLEPVYLLDEPSVVKIYLLPSREPRGGTKQLIGREEASSSCDE